MADATMERRDIRFAGSGGQGLILGARILFRAMTIEGLLASQSQSYEPTSRGGFCHADLVVSDRSVDFPLVMAIDCLLALDQVGADRSAERLAEGALVVTDKRLVTDPPKGKFNLHAYPLTDEAISLGSPRVANMIGLAAMAALGKLCSQDAVVQAVMRETPPNFRDLNLEAVARGHALAASLDPDTAEPQVA